MRKCKLLSTICLIFLLVAILIPLASCHGILKTAKFEVPEGFDPNKNISITFWAKNENNEYQQAVYHKAVRDFEALYPNIDVTLKLYSDYNDIYKDVITNITTGTTPNVCITYPDHIATYMTGENVVVPLDDLMNDPRWGFGGSAVKFDAPTKDEIIPQFLAEGVIDGVQYAIPYMRSTEALYINATMLRELGYDEIPEILTWDFVWEASERAMALGKDENGNYNLNGQKTLIPFIYKSTDNMMIQMLEQKGAGYSKESGEILIFNDTTKELLYDIADHTSTGAFSTFKISSYPGNYLNAGQCIFAVDSTAGATWMGPKAPQIDIPENELVDCEIVVRAIPQFDEENPKMISQGPSICIFNKENTDEVMASWLFVQYLLTNDVQIAYSQTEGYLPVTSKAHNDPAYQDYLSKSGQPDDPVTGLSYYSIKIDASKLLLDNLDATFITPVFNGSANLRNAAGQMIEEVCKSIRRKQTVDEEYMAALYEKMTSLYKLEFEKTEFDGIPTEAKYLIGAICAAWVFIVSYNLVQLLFKRKKHK